MFRIDDNFVIDATKQGNAARFINHSCDVSCVRAQSFCLHSCAFLFSAQLFLKGSRHIGTQAYYNFCVETNTPRRGVDVRLQIPNRRG